MRTGLCPTAETECLYVGAGNSRIVQVTGQAGIPSVDVDQVVIAVTAYEASGAADGDLFVYEQGATQPGVPQVQYTAGESTTNTLTIPVNSDGRIRLTATSGTHVIVDIQGYFADTDTHAYTYNGQGLRTSSSFHTDTTVDSWSPDGYRCY